MAIRIDQTLVSARSFLPFVFGRETDSPLAHFVQIIARAQTPREPAAEDDGTVPADMLARVIRELERLIARRAPVFAAILVIGQSFPPARVCLLYTSDAADE